MGKAAQAPNDRLVLVEDHPVVLPRAAVSAHTPGPWKVEDDGREVVVYAVEGSCRVASIELDNLDDRSHALRDARLIAAAPDLLGLVRDLLSAHDGAANVSDDPFPDDLERSREWLERIHAAIAKAEGRE